MPAVCTHHCAVAHVKLRRHLSVGSSRPRLEISTWTLSASQREGSAGYPDASRPRGPHRIRLFLHPAERHDPDRAAPNLKQATIAVSRISGTILDAFLASRIWTPLSCGGTR